jgi:hypothetical protein
VINYNGRKKLKTVQKVAVGTSQNQHKLAKKHHRNTAAGNPKTSFYTLNYS